VFQVLDFRLAIEDLGSGFRVYNEHLMLFSVGNSDMRSAGCLARNWRINRQKRLRPVRVWGLGLAVWG
jgi:hypothetical protein